MGRALGGRGGSSRKHHARHNRSRSHYPERLAARGLTSVSVRMLSLEELRKRAGVPRYQDLSEI